MELLDAHERALAGVTRLVERIEPGEWANDTPCTEWTVRDLLNHLVAEQLWVPPLLAGSTIEEVGDRFDGDVLGDDPVGSWRAAAGAARDALVRDGALEQDVHLSRGPTPATYYAWELTLDLAVHGWDLARGVDAGSPLDAELAEALLGVFDDEDQGWREWGDFGTPAAVEPDADPPARLVALLGRRP
ncbi:TIGR03086 family metal-binding protein [Saccharothrix luteola]|uniref:TIGR03086 family metal-binding protein n=1 Tax=Saccharothrix luteola TaxID=2893018 RepID=UPI001E3F8642|nr:TIGR03086 family metal-binding protein [Saccharothrix luteola]MCC8249399.1 TIGR03086 family metal-binding protein [Saccharothrix luteola]